MEAKYVDICNRIAGFDKRLDLFRPPYAMQNRIPIPEDIVLLIGEFMQFKSRKDVPKYIEDVGPSMSLSADVIVLKKNDTTVTLSVIGNEIVFNKCLRFYNTNAKSDHQVVYGSDSIFWSYFSMPGLAFKSCYFPNDADSVCKYAYLNPLRFGHYTVQVPTSRLTISDDPGKMQYLRDTITTERNRCVRICMSYTFANSVDVNFTIDDKPAGQFSLYADEITNEIVCACDAAVAQKYKRCIDFLSDAVKFIR